MDNYWFLYNISDGTFYGAPYLGNATEWTNIPDGCAILGPYAQGDATDTIKDAFMHSTYYTVQNGELTPVDNIEELRLNDAKQQKIFELTNDYNLAMEDGFMSYANGTNIKYGFSADDQSNYMELLMSLSIGLLDFPITVYSKDGQAISLAEDQLKQLLKDKNLHKSSLDAEYNTLVTSVNNCNMIEQVNSINF
jgi:hypothetical protein